MLSRQENLGTLTALEYLSRFNLGLYRMDKKTGVFTKQTSKLRWWAWHGLFVLGLLFSLHTILTLMRSVFVPNYFRPGHIALHIVSTTAWILGNFGGYQVSINHPDLHLAILNQLFTKETVNPDDSKREQKDKEKREKEKDETNGDVTNELKGPTRRWRDMSRQELVGLAMWVILTMIWFGLSANHLAESTRSQLEYNSLPQDFQNGYTFTFFVFYEAWLLAFLIGQIYLLLIPHVLFFLKCDEDISNILMKVKGTNQNGLRALNLSHTLHDFMQTILQIRLFNKCHAFAIFGIKIHCICCGTILPFGCIKYWHANKFIAFVNGMIGVQATSVFSIAYEKAFSIPDRVKLVKGQLLVAAREQQQYYGFDLVLWVEKVVRGVPLVGIRVGSFHTMERESTPNFLDFVTQQLVSLLLSF